MTVNELKRALTYLRLFNYEDLLEFQQVLVDQYNYIENTLLAEEKKYLLRALSRKEDVENMLEQIETNTEALYVIPYTQYIQNLKANSDIVKKEYSKVLENVSSGFDVGFDGNVFSIPSELKTILNNYKGDDSEIIYALYGEVLLLDIINLVKTYIKDTELHNSNININKNITNKSNKIIKSIAAKIHGLVDFKNKISSIINDIDNAKNIVITTGYTGDELDKFLQKSFTQIRSELNV